MTRNIGPLFFSFLAEVVLELVVELDVMEKKENAR
ncbi:MAG: Uncharacterised protein [Prochlorococcus marinus str. MIT 9215]|nr:MAG: Uncharacterised protein [Prochlorococcus marinus str. MIT 9215]